MQRLVGHLCIYLKMRLCANSCQKKTNSRDSVGQIGFGVFLSNMFFDLSEHGWHKCPSGHVKRNLQDTTVFASLIISCAGLSKSRFSW